MQNPTESRFDTLIREMSIKAAEAATQAWKRALLTGKVGNFPIPDQHQALLITAERFFKAGYGMALVDNVMQAVQKLKTAQEQDQKEAEAKIRGLIH